ncbi:hypothetical protein [Sphingobium sp. LMC3-1-1.1]|uniref:hypothetical protein n=1 Tax=Sphingobium sp. LMC3-1-1.1 TaxID=3135241 RepID=UPI00341B3BDD
MTQLSNFDVQHVEGGKPIKLWTRGVPVDEKAHEQLRKAAQMPFVFKHVAAIHLPDEDLAYAQHAGAAFRLHREMLPADHQSHGAES